MQNSKCKTDAAEREQRVLAHYAEPQGGKALGEGLIQNAKFKIQNAKSKVKIILSRRIGQSHLRR